MVLSCFLMITWLPSFFDHGKKNAKLLPGPKTAFFSAENMEKLGGSLGKWSWWEEGIAFNQKPTLMHYGNSRNQWGQKTQPWNFRGTWTFQEHSTLKKCHMISSWVDVCLSPPKAAFVFLPVSFNEKKTRREDLTLKSKGTVGYPWESTRDIYQHIPPIYGFYNGCVNHMIKTLWESVRHMMKFPGCFTTMAPSEPPASFWAIDTWRMVNTIFFLCRFNLTERLLLRSNHHKLFFFRFLMNKMV